MNLLVGICKFAIPVYRNIRYIETSGICDLICENRPLPAFWRSRVITAVLVPRHLGTRKKILKAIGLTLVEIYSKVFVVLDKYFSQKMPCERVAKVCMSISVFVRVY